MTPQERIAKIQGNRWIKYACAERTFTKLEDLFKLPTMHRMPNLLIVGEKNNGKTAFMKYFLQRHPPQSEAYCMPAQLSVLAVQAPPIPDERRFYQAILKQAFGTFRSSHSAGQLQNEVFRLLSTLKKNVGY